MKILAVSTSSFTSTNREIYRRLSQAGMEVLLVIPKYWDFGRGKKEADAIEENDPSTHFLEASNSHQRLYQLKGIESLIQEFKPEVIYLEGDPGSRMAVKLSKASKRIDAKFMALSCENLSQNPMAVVKREGIKSFFAALVKYAMIKTSLKNTHTLFVINNAGLEYFKALGFKRVIKTPLGFNENTFKIDLEVRKRIREQLQIGDHTKVIAYYGRIVYEKGVHTLVESLGKLKHKEWLFLIDEFGRYRTDYQEKIKQQIKDAGIEDRTIFFEADHKEIAQYMNASDITVLASVPTQKWVEQYGRVVPEAIACGNLLIISDKGAQQEFFDDQYSYKFPVEDSQALSELIQKALGDSDSLKDESNSDAVKIKYSLNAQVRIFTEAVESK